MQPSTTAESDLDGNDTAPDEQAKTLSVRLRFDQVNDILNGRGVSAQSVTDESNGALLSVRAQGFKPKIDITFDRDTQEMMFKVVVP